MSGIKFLTLGSNLKGISNGVLRGFGFVYPVQKYLTANMTNPNFLRVDILYFVLQYLNGFILCSSDEEIISW